MKLNNGIAVAIIMIAFASCTNNSTSEGVKSATQITNGIATSTFKVSGNCEMCKETIEGSLKVEGVTTSNWDTETKIMMVSYDTSKINLDKIQKNIASVGYDNEKYKGDDKVYTELPECCQYERK